jgi:hypothetical protein
VASPLTIVALTVVQVAVFIASPPPATVIGFFKLFQKNALLGLLSMDLLLMIDYALWGLIYVALYAALHQTHESAMLIATVLGLIGIAIYFASNTSFNMLVLSHQYTAATAAMDKAAILAAGEAMLATYKGTAFQVSYLFLSVAPLTIAIIMVRGAIFGKATAWVGVLGNVLGFGMFVPVVGIWLATGSVLVLAVWNVMFARTLLRLARPAAATPRAHLTSSLNRNTSAENAYARA